MVNQLVTRSDEQIIEQPSLVVNSLLMASRESIQRYKKDSFSNNVHRGSRK